MNEDAMMLLKDIPFVGNEKEWEELSNVVFNGISEIKKSDNIRHTVLETWIIIDYFLYAVLGKAFNVGEYNTDEKNWEQIILPNSFQVRLEIFEKLLISQKELPKDPYEYKVRLPGRFWIKLKEDKEFFKKFEELEYEYYKKYHPEIIQQEKKDEEFRKTHIVSAIKSTQYRTNNEWYELYKNLPNE